MWEKALKPAVFGDFHPPILPCVSGAGFWGGRPAAFWRGLTGVSCCVPETGELGTAAYQLNTLRKALKNVFINRIWKPVS